MTNVKKGFTYLLTTFGENKYLKVTLWKSVNYFFFLWIPYFSFHIKQILRFLFLLVQFVLLTCTLMCKVRC